MQPANMFNFWTFRTAVYSVGMYVDAHGAKKALHKFKGEDLDELMGNQKLFDGEQHSSSSSQAAAATIKQQQQPNNSCAAAVE
jgi:ribosomal protein L12E/L44/L45/RPP1/RPP2